MENLWSNQAALAAVAAMIGGIGVKVVERYWGHQDRALDDAASIRKELRDELADMRLESKEWQEKYFIKANRVVELESEVRALRLDVKRLQNRIDEITPHVKPIDPGDSYNTPQIS